MKKLSFASALLSVWFIVSGILIATNILNTSNIGNGVIISLLGLNLLIKELQIGRYIK